MTLLSAAGGIRDGEAALPPPLVLDMSSSSDKEVEAVLAFWKTIEDPVAIRAAFERDSTIPAGRSATDERETDADTAREARSHRA
jgi:hypothetical protein